MPEDVTTVAGLREWLRGCGEPYATALGNARRVRAAVNQEMDEPDDAVKAGEIAWPRYESYLKIRDEDEKYRK